MNYSGKFDAKVSADGLDLHSKGHVHVETVHATHAPSDAIVVPDAHLLFNGDFKRSGVDLILSRNDQELVLHDYFKGEKRAALSSPDGAHLTGDLVNALAGHVEYAQADGSASVSKVIGHVTKLAGTATVIRNGVSVILNNGDNVEKGDVVQSGSNSTLGITFIDGTVFGLLSNARMVLNEMVYDPNGSNNSTLLSLVAGTITFVAGETAKHGDMKVDTPVATMGIRGTAVLVEIDFTVPGQGGTPDAKFQVLVEPDGTTGSYILFDKTTLTPLAVVDKAGLQINISNGILSQTTNPLSPEIQKLITDVFSLKFSDSNPQTNTHFTDSIIPQALPPIKLASGSTATPFILISNDTPPNSPPSPGPIVPPVLPHIDQPPQAFASGKSLTVHTGTAKSTGVDTVSGPIRFTDLNAGDLPTVTTHFVSLKLLDAQHNDITATLTPQQMAAVEAQLVVTPSPGNHNNGSATWTYSVADSAFNFLTAGETLTLTYDAVVNNNFLPFEQKADAPFTITINGPGVVEWIHPTGDLWSVGSNWNSGTVPTAADDAIIPAEHIPGGTGLYDVTIVTPAVARTLTLNANNTTGGQVINHSTLTIGEALTIFNDGVLNNLQSGTVSVGGQIELLNRSSILNSGLITLGQGGDFKDQSSVTNSGTIDLAGGTLNVQVAIANSGGIIQVDGGTTLNLNGAAIDGGTITGQIGITGDSSINNAALNNTWLTVDATKTLTLNGTTITGDVVTDNGTIHVTGDSAINNAALGINELTIDSNRTLTLDTTSVFGGTITDNGTVKVDAFKTMGLQGVALSGGTISNAGTIEITAPSSIENDIFGNAELRVYGDQTLTLSGTEIIGGTINDFSGVVGGTIDVTGNSSINGTTTDNEDVPTTVNAILNNGGVRVESGVTLTLDNVTVNGTTVTDTASGAILQIDVGTTLTLKGGATIDGGTINDGTAFIDVKDAARIDGNATLNNGLVTVESGATLTLDNVTVNGTTFTDIAVGSTIQVDGGDTLKLNSATINGGTVTDNGMIDISGAVTLESGVSVTGGAMSIASGATLDIENAVTGTGAALNGVNVMNSGTIQVDGPARGTTIINLVLDGGTTVTGGTLLIHVGFPIGSVEGAVEIGTGGATFDHVTVTNNNSLKIDDSNTLTLSQVTINGGTINDGTADGAGGTIDVIGNSSINGTTIGNGDGTTTVDAILNNGGVTVESGVTLTLDNVRVNGTIFTDLDTSSIVQVDDGDTLTLNGAVINGGTIIATGKLDLANATVNGGTLGGAGTIATAAGNTDSTLNGVTIASSTLVTAAVGTLDLIGIITSHGEIDATTGKLDLENATVDGGTLGGAGTIATATGNTDSTLNGVTIAASTLVTAAVGTLDLTGTITNHGEIDATTGTLDLENATINGGTLGGAGTIAAVSGDNTLNSVTIATGAKLTASNLATLDLTGTVTNNGEIDATASKVNVAGNITGTGSIDIFNNAKLEIGGSVSSGETVTFGAKGGPVATAATLILDDSHHFGGTIVGLTENPSESLENRVDLKDLTFRPGDMHVSIISGSLADGIFKVSNGIDFVDLHLSGVSSGTFEFAADATGGTLLDDPPASGTVTIDSGKALDITAASTAAVSFTNSDGNTGELVLDNSKDFTGKILGFAGDGTTSNSDLINLTDVNIADVAINKTTYTDSGNGTGTLTLYNANGQALDSLTFAGSYQLANFTIESDGSGHTLIVDPPASASESLDGIVMQDPGPAASSTIVASAPNQTLTGFAASDTFVFKFADVGHAIVADFHPATDMLQFSNPIFASALAALNATHDDGHGNAVVAIDAHDTITLNSILKAQLHASDFHVV